jgi:hypothetical protein
MPQPVAKLEEPNAILRGHDLAVAREIREIRDSSAEPFFLALADMPWGLIALERAKLASERELLLVRQGLIANDQDGVPLHRGVNRLCPRP